MDLYRKNSVDYSKHFKYIVPLSIHPAYCKDYEFSDKIIVPRSMFKDLLRSKLPFPPQLILIPDRYMHNCIHCTVLEFTAEEGFLYLPLWMLRELGYKVLNTNKSPNRAIKRGYGVTLSNLEVKVLNNSIFYTITKCNYAEYYSDAHTDPDFIKSEVSKYMFIREDSSVSVLVKDIIVIITVIKVKPNPISTIQGDFQLVRLSTLPIKPKAAKEESTNTEMTLSQVEKFPLYPERLPRFLVDIMTRKITSSGPGTMKFAYKDKEIYHKKNFSYAPAALRNLPQSRTMTPDLEKYIKPSRNTEIGKSIEESIGYLPSVYSPSPKLQPNSPQLLTITIPELTLHAGSKLPTSKFFKITQTLDPKKPKPVIPLKLNKPNIDGLFKFHDGKIM
jgi:Ubiquitin fusion degradation protein UFD1